MSDATAYATFKAVRFADNGGEPFCPHCGVDAVYEFKARRIYKCKACEKQFSLTSGTIFASRKLSYRDILTAIALFVNGVNGVAALRLSRELCINYRTAFVLTHKLREVFGAMATAEQLTGVVEIDGAMVGGSKRLGNIGNKGKSPRAPKNGKERSVVSLRERGQGGRTLTFVVGHEKDALAAILKHVHPSATVVTDEAGHWNVLHLHFDKVHHVNHSQVWSQRNGVHTNIVESLNSRLRRNHRGVHHRISPQYVHAYAAEVAWREDFRRTSNGQQFMMVVGAAARQPISRDWKGYWQRRGERPPKPPRVKTPRPEPIVLDFRPRA